MREVSACSTSAADATAVEDSSERRVPHRHTGCLRHRYSAFVTTQIPTPAELEEVDALPLEERAAALEDIEGRLRDALDHDTEA